MKILIACGGTGGHILPALRLAEELFLRRKDVSLFFLTGKRQIERRIIPPNFEVIALDASTIKIGREFITSCFRLLKTAFKSFFILLEYRPDVVVGFGGYASFFVVFFAWFFRIKTIIHEENVYMGKANRLLAYFVDRISLGFKETKNLFSIHKNKMVVTGNPLRSDFKKINKERSLQYFGFLSDRFTILVMGGSQGSHKINIEFLKTVLLLKDKIAFQIIHLSGDYDYNFLNVEYNNIGIKWALFKFLDSMHYAFSSADLVICRAGAMTISELIFFELPAIIIPYPYAYGHQIYNAGLLVDSGCAVLLEDKQLDSHKLAESILGLTQNPQRLMAMRHNYNRLKSFTSTNLWDLVLSSN